MMQLSMGQYTVFRALAHLQQVIKSSACPVHPKPEAVRQECPPEFIVGPFRLTLR